MDFNKAKELKELVNSIYDDVATIKKKHEDTAYEIAKLKFNIHRLYSLIYDLQFPVVDQQNQERLREETSSFNVKTKGEQRG